MELKVGKMPTRELAEWFGIGYGSFRNKKEEKLKELSFYCSYQLVYGGIIIDKIYVSEYIKPTPAYKFVLDNFEKHWHKSGLDTAARVGSEMYYTYKDNELKGLKESTIKQYVAKARLEKYGHVYLDDHGTGGRCKPEPVVDNKWEEAVQLTPEQYEIWRECLKEAYYSEEDAIIEEGIALGYISEAEQEAIKKSKEETQKEIRSLKHEKMITLCSERLGFYPNQITKLIKELYF